MEDLASMRRRVEEIDGRIAELFEERMALTRALATGADDPQPDIAREVETIAQRTQQVRDSGLRPATAALFTAILTIGRARQDASPEALAHAMRAAFTKPPKPREEEQA